MYGKPRSKRIRHPTERDHHVSRAGRPITCQNCWDRGHNKGSCKNPPKPKPPKKGPSKATKGGKGDGSGLSKATKGGKGVGSGHLKATKGSKDKLMTSSQDQLFRQDQDALEDLLHEEERRRQMEWESNRRMYKTWSDLNYEQDHQAPNEGQAPNEVQAPNEGKAPSQTYVVNSAPSRVLKPRSQRIASKKMLNYVNDGIRNTLDKPVKL
ncbi:hypothetical protein Tco_1420592 [Tanacetum coccineum]